VAVQEVKFLWSTEHGHCYDCGAPAAFKVLDYELTGDENRFCAVCAANHAADGYEIRRIEELE